MTNLQYSHVISKLYVESLLHVSCHVMSTSPQIEIESTLSHIILPCSLQPLLPQFSIAAIRIVAKNKAVLSLAPVAPLHGFSLLPHTPVEALVVVKVYCPVEQLDPGGAEVLN